METRVLPSIDSVGLHEDQWNSLVVRSETNTVFQTYQWVRSWHKVFGYQYDPLLVSVNDSSAIVGIGPLMIKRGQFGERIIRFLADGKSDYCDFIATGDKPKVLKAIFGALFEASECWDVIELNNIPTESSTIGLVSTICRDTGYRTLIREQFKCPTLLIRGHEEEALKIFNKATLRRRQRYFERNGSLEFKDLTGEAVLPYLDRFFNQHIARWSGSESPSLFLNEDNRAFYRELAACMADKRRILFSVVEFNGQPIAMHFGVDYDGTLLWYKPSFDVTYAKHSPGLVLLRHLIEYAIKQKRDEFDFTIGDEAFKSRFTNHIRKTSSLKIFKNAHRYFLELSKWKLLASTKKLPWE
jgi:CelD/BcsL family acetyltransferase involved in cellulose biosynthesis